jgi:WD40 repeat protein
MEKINIKITMKYLLFLLFFAFALMQANAGGPHGIESDTVWYRDFGDYVFQVKFSPDGNLIYATVNGSKPYVLDVATSNTIKQFEGMYLPNDVAAIGKYPIDLTVDGKYFYATNQDSLVEWDTQTNAIMKKMIPPPETWTTFSSITPPKFIAMSVSPDGNYLAATIYYWTSVSSHGEPIFSTRLYIWDTHTWKITKQIGVSAFEKIIYSYDGNYLACGEHGNNNIANVTVFDTKTWQIYSTFSGHTSQITDLSFSPDNSLLASSSWDGSVKIWSLNDKKLYKQIVHNLMIESVCLYSNLTVLYSLPAYYSNNHQLDITDINSSHIKDSSITGGAFNISINKNNYVCIGGSRSVVILNENKYLTYVDENQIHNNYINFVPNPIDSYANVIYSNLDNSNVSIDIFDSNSREVDKVYDGYLESGKHELPWFPKNLSDGMYFCRVRSNNFTKFIKVIISR